jgi:transaldolase
MKKNSLVDLENDGQGVWLDYIRRDLFSSGELKRLIDEDGITGMTSNPSIFEKAISSSADYDTQLGDLLARDPKTPVETLYESIAIQDIQSAADLLLPVYNRLSKADGFVSLEVSPELAEDTQATITQARRLWKAVARPNVMIKVPATKKGIPAIEKLIAEGININITLMFTMTHYEEVTQAYISGLKSCQNPQSVDSVASFFVSRVDTAVDKILEEIGSKEALDLRGKVAIANSQMIYHRFKDIFYGDTFASLLQKGARVQRPLWASTSTKNPNYPDVLYVESLAGRNTVDTIPRETLYDFRDHGIVKKDAVEKGEPQGILTSLDKLGIDLKTVGEKLQQEGVDSFALSYKKILKTLEEKRKIILSKP